MYFLWGFTWISLSGIIFLCYTFSLFSEDFSKNNQLEAIDTKLVKLQKEIHQLHLKILRDEVESQSYMKSEWKEYINEIQEAESHQQKLEQLKKEYERLKQQKKSFLQNSKSL